MMMNLGRYFLWVDAGFLPGIIFQGGGQAKSIVIQISFVMLIFLLFSDQISGALESLRGELPHGAPPAPPCKKARTSFQIDKTFDDSVVIPML